MKMVKNLQRSLLISLISILLLAAVGCNSNPVSLYDGSDSPLSSSFDPGVTTKKPLDILWVIDNSGSMGEEQVALLESFSKIADTISNSGLDVHMGVTTTNFVGKGATFAVQPAMQTIASGELLTKSYATIYSNSTLLQSPISKENKDTIKKIYEKAWGCAEDQSKKTPFSNFTTDTELESIADKFPAEDNYRVVAPDRFLSTEDYRDSSGKLEKKKYIGAFECLTLVGLGGSFIERGLAASYKAVDPMGVNASYLSKFLRPDAPLLLIIVSDENDCSIKESFASQYEKFTRTPNPSDLAACTARYCDFFNLKGFDEKYPGLSPLIPPSEAAKRFIQNVKKVKGEGFDPDKIFAFSITGPNRQMVSLTPKTLPPELADTASQSGITVDNNYMFDFSWPTPPNKQGMIYYMASALTDDSACYNKFTQTANGVTYTFPIAVPPKNNLINNTFACYSKFGKATSGDRYLRFLDAFKNRFPEKAKASPNTNVFDSGLICLGELEDVSNKINSIISATDACIPSEALSGCDNNASVGDKCGVGDSGTCQEQFHTTPPKKLFCTSYIQVLATATDAAQQATLKASPDCVKDSYGTIAGFPNSCIVDPSKYTFVGCLSNSAGVQLDFSSSQVANDLRGIPLQVRYTSVGTKSK